MKVSRHAKERIIERNDNVNDRKAAIANAKIAFNCGKKINYFNDYPNFAEYLRERKAESGSCIIRVYNNHIYIWKGRRPKTLVTAHPVPARFLKEMGVIK